MKGVGVKELPERPRYIEEDEWARILPYLQRSVIRAGVNEILRLEGAIRGWQSHQRGNPNGLNRVLDGKKAQLHQALQRLRSHLGKLG